MPTSAIVTYTPPEYLARFIADPAALRELLAEVGLAQFFIVPVEELYPLFVGGMPPTRTTGHTLLYLTSGTARLRIGPAAHVIGAHEALLVRAGQVYSLRHVLRRPPDAGSVAAGGEIKGGWGKVPEARVAR